MNLFSVLHGFFIKNRPYTYLNDYELKSGRWIFLNFAFKENNQYSVQSPSLKLIETL